MCIMGARRRVDVVGSVRWQGRRVDESEGRGGGQEAGGGAGQVRAATDAGPRGWAGYRKQSERNTRDYGASLMEPRIQQAKTTCAEGQPERGI